MIPVRNLAHGRAGDKGNTLNVSIIAFRPADFDHLEKHVTEAHCADVFQDRGIRRVTRYVLPNLFAMNFVVEDVLDGGVNQSLYVDRHGKTLSSLLLDSLIPAPEGSDV
ncbi:MAG: hypothetical protein AAFQ09_11665 [Pseudomonadota bacterium]